MTEMTAPRTLGDVLIREPLALAAAQPHQVLLSTGSVAIMAQFAASSGIVAPLVGYCIAIGVEWAYLRGLASDSRARTWWGGALNWSAFGVVVLWGVLWCGGAFGVLAERPVGWVGWVLAVAHVVPIAWLSLCAAMCHRAALAAEDSAARQAAERHAAWELAQAEEDRKLERWKAAQRLRLEVRLAERDAERDTVRGTVRNTVTARQDANRAELRAAVVAAYRDSGESLNVSQAAAALGISRGLWYKLRDAARAAGELP